MSETCIVSINMLKCIKELCLFVSKYDAHISCFSLRSEVSEVDGVVTPVRRSTRLRRSFLPEWSKGDGGRVVDELSELPDNLHLLYKENMALHIGEMEEEEEV